MMLWLLRALAFIWTTIARALVCPGTRVGSRYRISHYWRACSFCSLVVCLCTACSVGQKPSSSTPPSPRVSSPAHSPTAITPPALQLDDWTTYHHDMMRSGFLTSNLHAQNLTRAWTTRLDGAVYAEPLVVAGHVIVATESNTLYSLDPRTGNILWHTNVGQPVALSSLPCGDIDPLGITGTPVFDAASGLIFAVAEINGPQHILVGIDAKNGSVRVHRVIDLPGMDASVHQQRAALAVYKGMIYVSFGGLYGDCGNYRGAVVGVRTDGSSDLLSFRVPTSREGGIWASSGPAIDNNGQIYVSVGNGETTSGDWDHSDSVLRLSPTLQLEDGFAPHEWRDENRNDVDLGSMGPLLLPDHQVFIAGKSGQGYVLHANTLGGVGGQIARAQTCNGMAMGGGAVANSAVLVPCDDGVRKVSLDAHGQIKVDWHFADMTLSPIIGGQVVYGLDPHGVLYAVNLANGNLWSKVDLGTDVPHFATPTLSGKSLFVGTNTGVVAVTVS